MKPDEIVYYVFKNEQVDYDMRKIKSGKKEIVQARYRSLYLIHYFYPELNDKALAEIFNKSRALPYHALTTVTNLIATDKQYEKEMSRYIKVIRYRIVKLKEEGQSVQYKMPNKRVILHRTDKGYLIFIKRLNGKQIEKTHLSLSDEAMAAIVESYQILK